MGALKIMAYIIIAIIVFSIISTYVIKINAPAVAGLIGQSLTSFFKSSSVNNTFVSNGDNFSYPGNWVIFSPSVIEGVPILQNSNFSNSVSNEISNSSVSILMPNSYIPQIIGDIPSFISGALSKNLSLARITTLIKNVNIVVVSDFPLPAGLPENANLAQIDTYLKSFNLVTNNSSKINISGYKGFLLSYKNITIRQIDNLSFAYAKIAVAVTGNTVCMILSLSSQNKSINTVEEGFDRVVKSIKCRVN